MICLVPSRIVVTSQATLAASGVRLSDVPDGGMRKTACPKA
jgi:hypothetical protein